MTCSLLCFHDDAQISVCFVADSDVGVAAVEKVIEGSYHSPRSTTHLKSGGAVELVKHF